MYLCDLTVSIVSFSGPEMISVGSSMDFKGNPYTWNHRLLPTVLNRNDAKTKFLLYIVQGRICTVLTNCNIAPLWLKTIKWFLLRSLVESDLFYCGFSSPKPSSNLSVSVPWLYLKTKISTRKLPRFCPCRCSPGLPCAFLKSVSSLMQKASGGPRMML